MATNVLKKLLSTKGGTPFIPLLIATSLQTHSQPALRISPVETALAGSIAARTEHPWLAGGNPGTLAVERSALHASFVPSSIGIEGFYEVGMIVAVPLDSTLRIGGRLHATGVPSYREVTATAIGAIDLTGDISIGLAATLTTLAIDGYGSAAAPSFDLGTIVRLSERIRAGGALRNMGRNEIAGTPLPQRILIGFAFDLAHGTTLSVDMMHELRRSAAASLGFSTMPVEGMTLRAGVANAPGTIALGVGYDLDGIIIEYGGAYLAPLGFRHAIGVGYRW